MTEEVAGEVTGEVTGEVAGEVAGEDRAHLRGRGLVLDDQVAPLLLEVDVLDVERPAVLDRVRFEQVQKVLDHSVLLRNKPAVRVRHDQDQDHDHPVSMHGQS